MLTYIKGDVTNPLIKDDTYLVLPHIVNDAGRMGSGVAKALFTRWADVRYKYLKWYAEPNTTFALGETQFLQVEPYMCVANMVAQHNLISLDNPHPIKYDALEKCMLSVRDQCLGKFTSRADIIAPKFGSERAGGDWKLIEQMIIEIWSNSNINVMVYEF